MNIFIAGSYRTEAICYTFWKARKVSCTTCSRWKWSEIRKGHLRIFQSYRWSWHKTTPCTTTMSILIDKQLVHYFYHTILMSKYSAMTQHHLEVTILPYFVRPIFSLRDWMDPVNIFQKIRINRYNSAVTIRRSTY